MFKKKLHKIYFGWWTVIAAGFSGLWLAGYHHYGFSAFFKPISSELGFSRAVASVPPSIGRFGGGFEAPIAGWLTDKYGPKWITLFGVFLAGLSLILMGQVNSLWAYYVVWGVMLGTGVNMVTGIPMLVAISNWFVRKRGLAMGVKTVLDSLSGVIVLPLVAWLIITQGWRTACLIGGVVMLLVPLPLVFFGVKRYRPEYYGLLPDGAKTEKNAANPNQMIEKGVRYASDFNEVEFTLRQAMKTSAFWILVISRASTNLVGPTLNIHLIPLLTDMKVDPMQAAGMMAMMIAVSIPFRLIGGLLADRVGKNRFRMVMAGAYLLQAVSFAIFLSNPSVNMAYVWLVIYGAGMGIIYAMSALIRARYFGRKAVGSIQGITQLLIMPIGVVAPIYAGWIYDTTGSYTTAILLGFVLLLVSAVTMTFVIPPKPPTRVTDVRQII
ncbi:MFS transporter [Chloroflexota bacterium]